MAAYLDASVLVALIGREDSSAIIADWLRSYPNDLVVSDLAVAESSAAFARQGRIGRLAKAGVTQAFRQLDAWVADHSDTAEIEGVDIANATVWVRLPDLSLRAPDATHIASAARLNATLVTLDHGMAVAARALGIACINPAESAA